MPLDLLELAGGREKVLAEAFDQANDIHDAPQWIVQIVIEQATDALKRDIMKTIVSFEHMFVELMDKKPRPPGTNAVAEAWDDEFEAFALPGIEQFVAAAGVSQKWVVDNLAGHLNIAEAEAFALKAAEGMMAAALANRKTVNQKLSYIGIMPQEIEQAWQLASAGEAAEAPPRYDFLTRIDESEPAKIYAPVDVTDKAVIHKPAPVEPLPTPPVIATLGEGKEPPKRRGRQNPNATWTLPADIFTGMRGVGIADKEAAEHCGIPRSTYTRIAGGVASEIGLTDDQASKLVEYAVNKRRELDKVIAVLAVHGLAAI